MLLSLGYCSETADKNSTNTEGFSPDSTVLARGFTLLQANCMNCHSPNKDADHKIAPTLAEVKMAYIEKSSSVEAFMKDIRTFVNNPTKENAKMKGAVKKYGLMPAMDFTGSELNAMAAYLYVTQLEKDEWYDKQYLDDRNAFLEVKKKVSDTSYLSIGKQYAMKTKSVLGRNLLTAIQSKGTAEALNFCNVRAIPLTDSMAQELNISIQRVSDQPRNPDNQANEEQLQYIRRAKNKIMQGQKISPVIKELNGSMLAYYPIMTNQMCLQCHGEAGKDITEETLNRINQLYPDDKAKNYKANQLRGIWVVHMEKRSQ